MNPQSSLQKNKRGAAAVILILGISTVSLIIMTSVSVLAIDELHMGSSEISTEKTFFSAEAGINEALYRLSSNPVPQPFSMSLEGTSIDVTVSSNPANPYQRIITSQATDTTNKIRTLQIIANTSSFSGGFDYAVQSGQGGIEILNNSEVIGDIYSNGNIFGGTGAAISARASGTVWVARGIPLTSGPSQEDFPNNESVAHSNTHTDVSQSFLAPADSPIKKIELYIMRNGTLPGDVNLKIVEDNGAGSPSTVTLVDKIISKNDFPSAFEWMETEFDIGPLLTGGATYWIILDSPTFDAAKHLVLGFNNDGTNYPDGEAKHSEDMEVGNWNSLNGDFSFKLSFGTGNTFARQIEVTEDLHAHDILKSEIAGDAYYQNISGDSTVSGNSFPGSADPDPKPFPIQDVHINDWKSDAVAGGELVGDFNVSGAVTLGPKKINGNLILDGSAHLIVSGALWITGDVTFTNPGAAVSLDPSFGQGSSVIVADGKIDINNNTTVTGSGDPLSYLLLLSTNYSIDPSSPAINASNNSDAVIFYAKNGMVRLYNGSNLNGTSGYYVRLEEGSTITYDPNLSAFTIPSGGGGDVGVAFGTWEEK